METNIQELITSNSQILREAIEIKNTKEVQLNVFWGIPFCTVELIQPSGTHLIKIDITKKSFDLISAHAEDHNSTFISGEVLLYIINKVLETTGKISIPESPVGTTDEL